MLKPSLSELSLMERLVTAPVTPPDRSGVSSALTSIKEDDMRLNLGKPMLASDGSPMLASVSSELVHHSKRLVLAVPAETG